MHNRETGVPGAREVTARFEEAAVRNGFKVERFGETGDGVPLLAARRTSAKRRISAYVSAGIHGDEPAGPLALIDWMDRGLPEPDVDWTILPLLNPTGWDAGTRTNSAGADLNRDFRKLSQPETRAHVQWIEQSSAAFDWAACLHEDHDAEGVYLYERTQPRVPRIGRRLLTEISSAIPIARASSLDGHPAVQGLITPHGPPPRRSPLSEAQWLIRRHARLAHVFEAHGNAPLQERIGAQVAFLRAGIMLAPATA